MEVLKSSLCGFWPVVAFVKSIGFARETGVEEMINMKESLPCDRCPLKKTK